MDYSIYRKLYSIEYKASLAIELFKNLQHRLDVDQIRHLFTNRLYKMVILRTSIAKYLSKTPSSLEHNISYKQRPICWYRKSEINRKVGGSELVQELKNGDTKMEEELRALRECLEINLEKSITIAIVDEIIIFQNKILFDRHL